MYLSGNPFFLALLFTYLNPISIAVCAICYLYAEYKKKRKEFDPTTFWFLLPLFTGLLGGLIGYISVKDKDPNIGDNLVWEGILVTTMVSLIFAGMTGIKI